MPSPSTTGRVERRAKFAEVIARSIIHEIVDQDLQPGDALPTEAAMREQYQVSRESVREALAILDVHGLIAVRPGPHGGPVVTAVGPRDFGKMASLYFQVVGATVDELVEARTLIDDPDDNVVLVTMRGGLDAIVGDGGDGIGESDVLTRGPKLSELVARRIVHDIAARNLAAGEPLLPRDDLMAQYQVGRTSLREALRILEIGGFITVQTGPGGGAAVADVREHAFGRMTTLYLQLARATLDELLAAARLVESSIASLAATRASSEQCVMLRAVLDRHDDGNVDVAPNRQAGNDFHSVMGAICGNRVLDLVSHGIREIYHQRVDTATDWATVHKEHEAIADAVFARRPDDASERTRVHMEALALHVYRTHPTRLADVIDWS